MQQAERIYMISDAAKKVQVEAHVLRYWEEELKIPAKRNEMGHRYYTEEDIGRFRRIKELKEQGLQLKAIRHMLKNGDLQTPVLLFEKSENEGGMQGEMMETDGQAVVLQEDTDLGKRHVLMVKKGEILSVDEKAMQMQDEAREQKSIRLQQLLKEMIAEAVRKNNEEICQEIKETMLKELDYQFRLQEEKEDAREEERLRSQEEHYHQIDELLRSYNQRSRKAKKARKKEEKENAKKGGDVEILNTEDEKNKEVKKGFLRRKHSVV